MEPSTLPRPVLDEFHRRAREESRALVVVHGERGTRYRVAELAAHTAAIVDNLSGTGIRGDIPSAKVHARDARYAEALSALDDLEQVVRPAIENARKLAAALATDIEKAEIAAAEAAAEANRQAQLEAAVQDEVQLSERERLHAIESEARKRLAAITGAR